jgi:hypothetical protein
MLRIVRAMVSFVMSSPLMADAAEVFATRLGTCAERELEIAAGALDVAAYTCPAEANVEGLYISVITATYVVFSSLGEGHGKSNNGTAVFFDLA